MHLVTKIFNLKAAKKKAKQKLKLKYKQQLVQAHKNK
ncbi:hypothetical protein CGLO_02182 [Colletotrichum gloeosporioides Cg-14]|uniref:Uncharacterized protein n=1 Tax=Colletotrichum gloeosporioides (strain Cg-14) TaxID=1237896 RepID=T0KZM5_COLGC|nr:hypothetical protein CGLO_02182 [Colletotrichum gloeosporioides Cg-14]